MTGNLDRHQEGHLHTRNYETLKQVANSSVSGIYGWHRGHLYGHIPHLEEQASPLIDLQNKDWLFKWSDKKEEA